MGGKETLAGHVSPLAPDFAQAAIDALTSHICVLNSRGSIIAVNQAWKNFYRENSAQTPEQYGIGTSYLATCTTASFTTPGAREMFEGLSAVLQGASQGFELEYPCDSPQEKRWFIARVTPFADRSGHVVVAHENITARKIAEERLARSEEKYRQLASEAERLSHRLMESSERERAWIARELHESIAQELSLVRLHLGSQHSDAISLANESIRSVMAMLRRMSETLSPVHIQSLGLIAAIEDLFERASGHLNLVYSLDIQALEKFFPGDWDSNLYRLVDDCVRAIPTDITGAAIDVKAQFVSATLRFTLSIQSVDMKRIAAGLDTVLLQQRANASGARLAFQQNSSELTISVVFPPAQPK